MASPSIRVIVGRPWLPTFACFVDVGLVDVIADYAGLNADIYDYIRKGVNEEVEFYAELMNEVGYRVLELGCGTGCLTIPLAECGAQIVAVDNSPAMIEHLRAKIKASPKVSIISVVAEMADYVSKCRDNFDLVIVPYNSFVHILDPEDQYRVVVGAARVLRRGGKLVIDVWISRLRPKRIISDWSPVQAPGRGWIIYSEQTFPSASRRIANILIIPAGGGRPVATSIEEYVFTRAQVLGLFNAAGLRTRIIPRDHPVIGGRTELFIVAGMLP